MNHSTLPVLALAIAGLTITSTGCGWSAAPPVVVYAALDSEYAEPILTDFGKQTHLTVQTKFDTESTKTVGLAQAILAEADRPRCDLFWNNEILHTIRLEKRGLLEPFRPSTAADFPPNASSPNGCWQGFAARARILLLNRSIMAKEATKGVKPPTGIADLIDPHWHGRVGIAKPLFGTTATHAACLFAKWGDGPAREFFQKLRSNEAKILSGNKQVATAVSGGQIAFGLTDTDDAMEEITSGADVEIVFPDQGPDQMGTLVIPNTLAVIKGCPHPQEARELMEYLLSPTIEERLARGASAQIPLNRKVSVAPRIPGMPEKLREMDVDFYKAADAWDESAKFLRDEFSR